MYAMLELASRVNSLIAFSNDLCRCRLALPRYSTACGSKQGQD